MLRVPAFALVLLFVPLFATPARAGDLDKAFKAIEVHDYFKARALFTKSVKKHPVAAWYGLSVISGRANNPFFNIDSAYMQVLRSDAAFTVARDKERTYVARFGVDHAAIEDQKRHVFDLAWQVAKGQHTIAAYDRFINTYVGAPQLADATLVRDHLAFEVAREANTAAAYQAFLDRYPMAREPGSNRPCTARPPWMAASALTSRSSRRIPKVPMCGRPRMRCTG
jgi:hypothetical protein